MLLNTKFKLEHFLFSIAVLYKEHQPIINCLATNPMVVQPVRKIVRQKCPTNVFTVSMTNSFTNHFRRILSILLL